MDIRDPARTSRSGASRGFARARSYALVVVTLWCLGLATGILSEEVSGPPAQPESGPPAEEQRPENTIAYFGPGDGEPAAVFRFAGEGLDSGVISVYLNEHFLYMVPLPRPDVPLEDRAGEPGEAGVQIEITGKHVEQVLGRGLSDPDLPPVKVSVGLYNRRTLAMGFVDITDWEGYLQGCWLQFPEIAEAAEEDRQAEPFLKPKVDISSSFGQAMPIDLRLEQNTIYYMLFASEDRDALLLNPEDPQLYARTRIVGAGTFTWKDGEDETAGAAETEEPTGSKPAGSQEPSLESGSRERNLKRLKYTPTSQKVYLVLWTLHRSPVPLAGATEASVSAEASSATEEQPRRVNGWTRSAVYELTNGPIELTPEGEGE